MGRILAGIAGVSPRELHAGHIGKILKDYPEKHSFLKAAKGLVDGMYSKGTEGLARKEDMVQAYNHLARIIYDDVVPKAETGRPAFRERLFDSDTIA